MLHATTVHHLAPARRRNHLRIMPIDHDRPDTMAPETDRDTPTNPEASPGPLKAMRPPPSEYDTSFLDQDDNTFSRAVKMIAKAARAMEEDRQERQLANAQAQAHHNEVIAAIVRADENSTRNYEMVRDEIRHLKDSDLKQDQRLKEGDKRFDRIEQSIVELKVELLALVARATEETANRIEELEQELAKAKRDAAAPPTPT